jgi:hypothetical protein
MLMLLCCDFELCFWRCCVAFSFTRSKRLVTRDQEVGSFYVQIGNDRLAKISEAAGPLKKSISFKLLDCLVDALSIG